MDYIKGAYALVIMSQEELVAVRDPHGFRPLVLGKRVMNIYLHQKIVQ